VADSARLDYHGGRRVTVPGVGLVEVCADRIIVQEPLSPAQENALRNWWQYEWSQTNNGSGGYVSIQVAG